MNKQAIAWILTTIVLCATLAVVRHNYNAAAEAVFWHIRHGRYIQAGALNVRVPLLYNAEVIGGKVMMMRLRHPLEISAIGFAPLASDQEAETDIRRATQGLALNTIAPQVEQRSVAGKPGECRAYSYQGLSTVLCFSREGHVAAWYRGPVAGVNEFRSVLDTSSVKTQ
jgi:hypothetical protein